MRIYFNTFIEWLYVCIIRRRLWVCWLPSHHICCRRGGCVSSLSDRDFARLSTLQTQIFFLELYGVDIICHCWKDKALKEPPSISTRSNKKDGIDIKPSIWLYNSHQAFIFLCVCVRNNASMCLTPITYGVEGLAVFLVFQIAISRGWIHYKHMQKDQKKRPGVTL